jgi:hypothetical protein
MRILALDTSTGPASIALVENGRVIATHEDSEAMRQSQRLVSATNALVRAENDRRSLEEQWSGIRSALDALGTLDLTYLERVCAQIGEALAARDSYHVVVVRSTVLPGTTHDVVIPTLERTSGKQYGSGFGVAVNPEFLREGTAVHDFRHPPLTLVGHNYQSDASRAEALYAAVDAPVVSTSIRTAEMIKYASNTWHALKVCFANEVGNLCKRLEVDSHEVMDIFCRDQKLNLSSYYMKPGFAFGGSCLPKDVRAMQYRARDVDLRMPVIESILDSNELQIRHAIEMVVETGKKRVLWALIITLTYSRYQFVWPTFRQTTEAVCEGLDRAWMFFGGIIRTLVPDNTKAMILDPDALAPTLVPAFLDYVQGRGMFVDPARVRSPKDKPRVENQVAFVRESWFDGEQFTGLAQARTSAEQWCREIAGTRVHGTTRKVPRDVFEASERAEMMPPPETLYDVPLYVDKAKVHPDHHIQVAQALYSVPNRYLRKHVRVRADRKLVKIYFGTELIKMHERQPPGGRATDPADYPANKSVYALRDVGALRAKAKEKGVHVGIYADRLLGGPLPWTKMRQAYALLSLCEKYGDGRVEAMCQSALAFDVVNVSKVASMLKSAAKAPHPASGKVVQLPLPRFVRPAKEFETRVAEIKSDKEGA